MLFLKNFFFTHGPVEYNYFFQNRSIWTRDETLTGTITKSQTGPGINGNEEILYTSQISRTGALDAV